MHKTCLYRYKKSNFTQYCLPKTILLFLKKALPSRQGQWSNLDWIALTHVGQGGGGTVLSEQLWAWSHTQGYFIRSEFLCTHGPKLYPKGKSSKGGMAGFAANQRGKKASKCWINSPKNAYPNKGLGTKCSTSLVNPFKGITSLSIQVTSSLDLGSGLQVLSPVNHTVLRRQNRGVWGCMTV